MSTDRRDYRTVVPTLPGTDLDVLRWLTRESMQDTAAADGLIVTDYREGEIPAEEIPRANQEHLDRPIEDHRWLEFTATAIRPAAAPQEQTCRYCLHPTHAGECGGQRPDWTGNPGPCLCPGDDL